MLSIEKANLGILTAAFEISKKVQVNHVLTEEITKLNKQPPRVNSSESLFVLYSMSRAILIATSVHKLELQ